MKDEYIIINRTALEKKIKDLENAISKCILPEQQHLKDLFEQELEIKTQILSQSTPLIPEIEKQSISFAKNLLKNTVIKAKSIEDIEEYHPKEYQLLLGELKFYGKERFKDYISNLKLDI